MMMGIVYHMLAIKKDPKQTNKIMPEHSQQ
jgi:hypothetical protein